jgi:hypothetical protein
MHSVNNVRLDTGSDVFVVQHKTGIRDESSVSFVPLHDSEVYGMLRT